tara:strand:+ start:6193 stop:6405 length:213 start_codon:yes stop_codon:yes gene_type:complete
MVLVDAILLFVALRIMCFCGEVIIFLLNITLGTQTTSYKREPTGPLSPCGQYEQVGWGDAIMWADVGNDL